jgi:hypothetical protein
MREAVFMKRCTILVLIAVIAGCAGNNIILKEFRPENTVHYSQLDKLGGISALNSYAVYLDKGDRFPLELSFDTDIIGIADRRIDMEAKQKLYFMLKMPENLSNEELAELENLSKEKISEMSESDKRKFFANYMLYISRDATEWAPVGDIKAIKKVFGIKGGTISFGVGISEKQGIRSYFDVKEVR